MSHSIDPTRLKELRKRNGLSQRALGKKAKLDKQSIYRIEAGRQNNIRQRTIEELAKALDVSTEMLTGQMPLPKPGPESASARLSNEEAGHSINVRVDGATRNAYTLTALRYQVPISRIVELAPFLFVLAAEASLARRKEKLEALRAALKSAEDLAWREFQHLPNTILSEIQADEVLRAEQASIEARDILAAALPGDIFLLSDPVAGSDYDQGQHNPFVTHLAQACTADSVASIDRFDRDETEFTVCREDALKLVGGEEELADSILYGEVVLTKMPRELFADDMVERRLAWLKEKREEHRAFIAQIDIEEVGL